MTVLKPTISLRQIASMFLISLLIVSSSPLAAYAEEVPPSNDTSATTSTPPSDTTSASEPAATTSEPAPASNEPIAPADTGEVTTPTPSTTEQGPTTPTGADSTEYTYNEATGLWESDRYTWDPVTKQSAPKDARSYSYNPETGMWDTTEWVYDAPSGTYVENLMSVATPPEGALLENTSDLNSESENDNSLKTATADNPDDTNSQINDSDSGNSGFFDKFNNVTISNTLKSLAETGDATVMLNTLAGNALTGSAAAIATIINLMQSSWSLLADSFTTFTQNLFGNFIGDLTLNPGSPKSYTPSAPDELTINAEQNAAIENDITLEAYSGDATVKQNTKAGDATSGDATAIANLINAINSSISAGSSFVGMLNIFGNLDGDILLPTDLTRTLLGSNAIGNLDTSKIENTSVLADFTNNQSITNDINLDATSGDATVASNTSAGSATTGDASTNLTVLNLTGRQIVGKDALLVFVNVLGKWVGMIVNAPTGATSAALGGGITGNSTLTANVSDNQTITNNVTVGAHSGDATVAENTAAGSATSGDAHAAVNLVNISGSQFALSDWFGILFINVFGSWRGSFGIDTAAGTIPTLPSQPRSHSVAARDSKPVSEVKAFRFAPTDSGDYTLEDVPLDQQTLALAASEASGGDGGNWVPRSDPEVMPRVMPRNQDWALSIIGFLVAGSLLGTERYLTRRNQKIS